MGITGFIASFAGAYISKFTKADFLLAIFAVVASVAAVMMCQDCFLSTHKN